MEVGALHIERGNEKAKIKNITQKYQLDSVQRIIQQSIKTEGDTEKYRKYNIERRATIGK